MNKQVSCRATRSGVWFDSAALTEMQRGYMVGTHTGFSVYTSRHCVFVGEWIRGDVGLQSQGKKQCCCE